MGTAGPIVYGCSRGPLCSAQLDRVQQRGSFDCFFLFQAEDGIRDGHVTGVQTCALPILYEEELVKLFEINDLSDPLGQRDQAIIETLYATGVRVSECQGLLIDDIDFTVGSKIGRASCRERA